MKWIAACGLMLACTPHHTATPSGPASPGISISLYGTTDPATSYGVVDDRRWIELAGNELVLEHVDPGASLASLVIEPLDRSPFAISRCAREALPDVPPPPPAPPKVVVHTPDELPALTEAIRRRERLIRLGILTAPQEPAKPIEKKYTFEPRPLVAATVRCAVTAAPGRHLVRILYVSRTLTYRAQHDVVMTAPDRVQLASRFAFQTPSWHDRAEVTVFDGAPGGDKLPVELVRGPVVLDGSIAILATPIREQAARLRRVYDGAVATKGVDPADMAWNAESTHAVWVWLELPHATLAAGPIHARVEQPTEPTRELDLEPDLRETRDSLLRLPLWADASLTGGRQRFADPNLGEVGGIAERVMLSISNIGDVPREVWVEEHVRPSRRRKVERAWPKPPTATGEILREKLEVKPHAIERVGYTVSYEF